MENDDRAISSHCSNKLSQQGQGGGSLQNLIGIDSQSDCFAGNQRTRRQNLNSRQKKYSSSVSSRQREGGSLPSNVNVVTHQLCSLGIVSDISLTAAVTAAVADAGKSCKKEQRRKVSQQQPQLVDSTTAAAAVKDIASNSSTNSCLATRSNTNSIDSNAGCHTLAGDSSAAGSYNSSVTLTNVNKPVGGSGGDCIIDICEPMMDIQQQQKILQSKGQDAATQVSAICIIF